MNIRKKSSQVVTMGIVGGVGNQLFQYYAGAYMAMKLSSKLKLDFSHVGLAGTRHESAIHDLVLPIQYEIENRKINKFNEILWRIHQKICRESKLLGRLSTQFLGIYQSSAIGFDPYLDTVAKPLSLRGYFQTWRYLKLLRQSGFADPMLTNQSSWYVETEELLRATEPVALHIRRGDYRELSDSFGLLSIKYYGQAIASLNKELRDRPIWVFSDDVESAKKLLNSLELKFTYLVPPSETNPLESLMLMSKCIGVITANSSFSWWAGALAMNAKQVIAPSKWFKSLRDPDDLIPENWTRVASSWE